MTYTIPLRPFPKKLSDMRILITNDDGIHAPGLNVLEQVAKSITPNVWTVAPGEEQSGAGHSLSLNRPLRYRQVSSNRYCVDGTPTDCVMMAVKEILKENTPDLLLSGVNYGKNIAEDVTYSGTVSAAMEGTLLGIPSVALSLAISSDHNPKWATVDHWAPEILKKLLNMSWPDGSLVNINFPDKVASSVKGIMPAAQGFQDRSKEALLPTYDPYGRKFFWINMAKKHTKYPFGTDLHYLLDDYITLTPLHLDLTHAGMLNQLHQTFS